jgi:Rrf2 family protein
MPVEIRGIILGNLFCRTVDLSCKTEYALLALIELAQQFPRGEPLQIRQIALQQQIPDRYLEQLLATLRRMGLVKSQRGAKGGYVLGREPWRITLLDVTLALEGRESPVDETVSKSIESVAISEIWQQVRSEAHGVLQSYTLQELCDRCNKRKQLDFMYYI